MAKSSLTIIGRDLIAGWVSLLSQRSGIKTSWILTSEGPATDPLGPMRIVSPLAPIFVGNRRQSLKKAIAFTQISDFRLDILHRHAADLPGKLLALAAGQNEMDETHRTILSTFIKSSLKEYEALKGKPMLSGMAWQASPMAVFVPREATAEQDMLRKKADHAGIPLEDKTRSFLGREFANVAAEKILVATSDCFSVDVAQMVALLRKTFLEEGGVVVEPKSPGRTDAQPAEAKALLTEGPVIVTDVETGIAWFGKLPRALPLAKMGVARRHFAARLPLPMPMVDLKGEFVAQPAARGTLITLPAMAYLSPAGPKRQLDHVALRRLTLMLGEPRDEMDVVQVWQFADNLPFFGEVPNRKNLWLAAGAGDLDAALAPALAVVIIHQIFGKPNARITRYFGTERFAFPNPFGRAKAKE